MIQFYKKRDFGTLISDTFQFFKEYGKNFFKNYIIINGLLMILMVVIVVIGYREFITQLFGSNLEGESHYFEQYFQDNLPVLIVVSFFVALLYLAVTMFAYTYPVLYMKRVAETGCKTVKTDEVLSDLKANAGRFLILLLGMTFIVMPLFLIIFAVSYLLVFIVIGLFVLMFTVPVMMNVINFLLFDYFTGKKGFFEALSYSIRAQFSYQRHRDGSPFWKYWGSSLVTFLIYYILISIFSAVPMVLIMVSMYAGMEPDSAGGISQNPFSGTQGIIIFVLYGISLIASFLLMNMVMVNSGLQYYDSRTDLHQKIDLLEIESIGSDEV